MVTSIARNPLFTENVQQELIKANADVPWKKTAYKAAAWGYWALAGAVVLSIVVTSVLAPLAMPHAIGMALAPTSMLVFALKETRSLWNTLFVAPKLTAYRQALAKAEELKSLVELQKKYPHASPVALRERYYRNLTKRAQNEANALFADRTNLSKFLEGYKKEEYVSLAAKVHAAAMVHLRWHPTDQRPLSQIIPIQSRRYDERVITTGREFGGDYLPGIPRADVRFDSIEALSTRLASPAA